MASYVNQTDNDKFWLKIMLRSNIKKDTASRCVNVCINYFDDLIKMWW